MRFYPLNDLARVLLRRYMTPNSAILLRLFLLIRAKTRSRFLQEKVNSDAILGH